MVITFVDNNKIGWYEDGKKVLFESDYIKSFENSQQAKKEAKKQYYEATESSKKVEVLLDCVIPCKDGKGCMYAVSVSEGQNGASSIFYKNIADTSEEDKLFVKNTVGQVKTIKEKDGELYTTLRSYKDGYSTGISVVSKDGKFTEIEMPFVIAENPAWDDSGRLIFNSYHLGYTDDFFCPSNVLLRHTDKKKPYYTSLFLAGMENNTLINRIKPLYDKDGNFYYIEHNDEPKKPSLFARIFYIEIQELIKKLIRESKSRRNRSRKRGSEIQANNGAMIDGKTMWINTCRVNIKKEEKKNRKFKDLGFVPAHWALVKLSKGEKKVLAYGIADYDIAYEKGKTLVVCTNGKKVFKLVDGEFDVKREVLFETERCVKLATLRE